ncbi:MAG: hypothetical protein K2Y20_12730 [Sphingomonas sp.]|nr:hypothetical protein [Sphingomonas sp.]
MKRFLLLLPLLASCAQPSSRFPSLLPRAIETRDDSEPMPASPPIVADPVLDARLTTALAALAKTRADFETQAARAEKLVKAAQGKPAGSEAWLDAQSALADLDVLRVQSSSTLTDLERDAIDRAAEGHPSYPALEAARAQATTQHDDEGVIIETLNGQLAPA